MLCGTLGDPWLEALRPCQRWNRGCGGEAVWKGREEKKDDKTLSASQPASQRASKPGNQPTIS